jgi:hypothetical protein
MTQPDKGKPAPTGQRPIEPHESALLTAAFCMMTFALVSWALFRMWERPVHDWQILGPVFATETIMPSMAIIAVVRWMILRKRVGLPINPQRVRVTPLAKVVTEKPAKPAKPVREKKRREKKPIQVALQPLIPSPATPVEQVDVALDDEPAAFVYPAVPDVLGAPFQDVMRVVRQLPAYPNILGELAAKYDEAFAGSEDFRKAEAFVIGKAEKHPDFDPNAYAEPVKDTNPALFLAQADEILPYAATVAAMVLIADQLPERVWDLLAAPWEETQLALPAVVLA